MARTASFAPRGPPRQPQGAAHATSPRVSAAAAQQRRPLRPLLGIVRARDGHHLVPLRPDRDRDRLAALQLAWCPRTGSSTRALQNFTLLTLILSLQASYAAPLILLAQNRQDDRDRVQIEQDRQRAERNLADTEYLAREVVSLRLAMKDVATKDFIRAELRALLEELDSASRAKSGRRRRQDGQSRAKTPNVPAKAPQSFGE